MQNCDATPKRLARCWKGMGHINVEFSGRDVEIISYTIQYNLIAHKIIVETQHCLAPEGGSCPRTLPLVVYEPRQ